MAFAFQKLHAYQKAVAFAGNARLLFRADRVYDHHRPDRLRLAEEAAGLPNAEDMLTRPFAASDEQAVVAVWEACGLIRPWNDPGRDIARKLRVQPELFLVGTLDDRVVATVMAGYDGHRGWINYLAVAPEHRHKGFAGRLVAEVERRLLAVGCPKINLQVRSSNRDVIAFYRRVGYAPDDVVSLGKRIIPDDAGRK